MREIQNKKNARVLILSFANEDKFAEENGFGKQILEQIKNSTIPIISVIKDSARDLVFEIVLASHLCIASDSAKFELDNPQTLKPHIGTNNLKKLSINELEINAEKAADLGFINKAVAYEDLKKEALDWAEQIAALAPLAIRSFIKAVNQGLETNLEDGLKLENELFTKIFASRDMKEGTNSFLEKRKPKFRGS